MEELIKTIIKCMYKKIIFLTAIFLLLGAGCGNPFTIETGTPVFIPEINDGNQINENTMESDNYGPKTERHLDGQKDLAAQHDHAVLKTSKGDIKVELYVEESPLTVNNFLNLAEQGFYDGTSFHRVIKDFMVQGGDPNSKDQSNRMMHGTGDPGYKFDDEFNNYSLLKGSLAMANSGPDTNGSQFFIVTAEATPWLDGKHVNFGTVVEGMDVVEAIQLVEIDGGDNPIEPVIIESIELE